MLLTLIGGVLAFLPSSGPDGAAVEDPFDLSALGTSAPPDRRLTPGLLEGTLGLSVGSRVDCLSRSSLGTGVIVEDLGLMARVKFESGESTFMAPEIRPADVVHSDGQLGASEALGPLHADPSLHSAWNPWNIHPGKPVICSSRPDLGRGVVSSLNRVFSVRYDSGERTQIDQEIRPAASEAPDPPGPSSG
jgi:hypothetical protein